MKQVSRHKLPLCSYRFNTVVPDAWIIEEKMRREQERKRKEGEELPLPISLPNVPDAERSPKRQKEDDPQRVIIIEL